MMMIVLAVVLDVCAAVRGEQYAVADLDDEVRALAVVEHFAGADRDDLAFLRLLLRGLGQKDAAGGL